MKNNNWSKKFKDNSPEKTIQNIIEYFEKYNYKIIEEKNFYVRQSGTYWCSLALYKNNNLILISHGKGSTEIMSLASGYGELYERYTALFEVISNPFLLEEFTQKNYNLYGYYLNPQEKIITEKDIYNNLKYKEYFKNWFSDDINKINNFINLINNNNILGIPFININNPNEITYENLPMLHRIFGTTGYAAGNSFEEALIQGSSEIFERLTQQKILSEKNPKLYQIDLESSEINQENKNIIDKIIKYNNNVVIFDLSYTYKLPVVMVCIFNPKKYKIDFKLGAHFDFNIALERCLTELFQGDSENNYNVILQKIINEDNMQEAIIKSFISKDLADTINPRIFLNTTITSEYNKNIFNDSFKNNTESYLKLKDILLKNNYKFFYRIISQSSQNNLYTIQCFIENELLMEPSIFQTKNFSEQDRERYYNFFITYYFLVKTIKTNPKNFQELKMLINNLKLLSKYIDINKIVGLCGYDFLSVYKNDYYLNNIIKLLNDNIKIDYLYFLTPRLDDISKTNLLKQLKNIGLSEYEIQQIWNYFSDEDIYKSACHSRDNVYNILTTFLIPYLKEINSIEYQQFISEYCESMK